MPKFPDILLNNNPDAPSVDLNNLQVKGVGIFADAAARDALNSNLHTEGYLAIMKDTDTPFIYTGGTWTDAANWSEVKGLWDEDGLGIKYTTTSGSVSILESTRPYQGSTITNLFGSSQSAPGGSRATRKLLHLHEGQLIFSTETNTPVSHIEMSNQSHSAAVGGAIGTSPYNMRIHGYHALEFTHGSSSFYSGSGMVFMDMPPAAANTGSIGIGKVTNSLGGIDLPSFGPSTVNTTNYSISMGGRIIFKNHSSVNWDAITQGPGTHHAAGVSLSSPRSSDILTAVSSDSNTAGSYGYVGINTYSPSATGPAFEVSSSYAKFNDYIYVYEGGNPGILRIDGGERIAIGPSAYSAANTVSVGANAGSTSSSGQDSVFIGAGAGNGTGAHHESVFIGYRAGADSGSRSSVLIGRNAGNSASLSFHNTVIGYAGMLNGSGSFSVAIGTYAGRYASSQNTIIGEYAGLTSGLGTSNVFLGYRSGYLNTGSSNVFIGKDSGYNETGSNKLYIANSDTTTPLIYGDFSTSTLRANGTFEIGDPASTGYAFPTATGALDEILKVDANGDLVFGAASIYPWESTADSNGNVNTNIAINPTGQSHHGNVGIGTTPTGGSGTLTVNGLIKSNSYVSATSYQIVGSQILISTTSNGTAIRIGKSAGNNTMGSGNYLFGHLAGNNLTSGDINNLMIGSQVGRFATGDGNVFLGTVSGSQRGSSNNVGIGPNTLRGPSGSAAVDNTGGNNVAVGRDAGYNLTTGGANVFLGHEAGRNKKTQTYNVIIGTVGGPDDAGNTGGSNIFVGRGPSNQSGGSNTTGIENVFLGAGAGRDNTTGSYNVAIGSVGVGTFTGSTGSVNVAINGASPGDQSRNVAILGSITNNGSGTAIGGGGGAATINGATRAFAVGDSDVVGDNGIAVGWNAKGDTNGISLGYQAGRYATGSDNISVGQYANHNVTGSGNVSIGSNTLGVEFGTGFPVTSSNNIAMGDNALNYATDSVGDNVAIGRYSLGSSNVNFFRGADAQNVAVGSYAGQNVNGSDNVFIGYQAGQSSSTQSTINNNVLIGYKAGAGGGNMQTTAVGGYAGYSAGGGLLSVSMGYRAGYSAASNYNTIVGSYAGENLSTTTGVYQAGRNTLMGQGASRHMESSYTVAIGYLAMGSPKSITNSFTINSVAIGSSALYKSESGNDNTAVGFYSGYRVTTGSSNIMLGSNCGNHLSTGSNNIHIGAHEVQSATEVLIPGIDGTTDYGLTIRQSGKWALFYGDLNVSINNPISQPGFIRSVNFQQEWNTGTTTAVDANQMYYVTGATTVAKASAATAATGTGLLIFTLGTNLSTDSAVMTGHVPYTITGSVGDKVYLSTTAGALTTTAPTGSGQIVRLIGYISSSNQVHLNPSNDWVEI